MLAILCVLAAACGGSESDEPGPPVGDPVLPDLMPAPPRDVHTRRAQGGWFVSFSSILVNVGDGEFLLRATRDGRGWRVEQDIPYSTSGADAVSIDAQLVWGGDGHEHWHISRVATNRLVRLNEKDEPGAGERRVDSKVGFCFFDFSRRLEGGPDERVHSRESCGDEDDDAISMGVSPGWQDTYKWVLPGQRISIDGLPDGTYRLWSEADERGWFREMTRDNNLTWVDFELSTRPDGVRTALVVDVGPEPG